MPIHTITLDDCARNGVRGVCPDCLQPRGIHLNGCPNQPDEPEENDDDNDCPAD
jgi:hypothetical protein